MCGGAHECSKVHGLLGSCHPCGLVILRSPVSLSVAKKGITCDPEIGSLVISDHLLPFGLLVTSQEGCGVWGVGGGHVRVWVH